MEKENIRPMDIEDFKDSQHTLDYTGNDSAIVNSLEGIPNNNDIARLECFVTAACIEECVRLDINYRAYQLKTSDLLLSLPNTVISHTMLSPEHKVRLVGFSTRFLQRIIKMEKETWSTAVHIHSSLMKSVSDGEDNSVFGFYRDLTVAEINDELYCYRREVMQHLFSALFYEMLKQLRKEIGCPDRSDRSRENIKQVSYTLRKFMGLLSRDKGIHRSVSCFANELRYIPRYFPEVIEQACGRTPSDLINEAATEQMRYRLKHLGRSIKEATEESNFPNQSFFRKYVKAHLGTLPISCRSREEDI